MKKKVLSTAWFAFIIFFLNPQFIQAQKKPDKNAVWIPVAPASATFKWEGNYKGNIPCADCEGIQTVIQLFPDYSYKRYSKYGGKGDRVSEESGKFLWKREGNYIVMIQEGSPKGDSAFALLSKDRLTLLDKSGKRYGGAAGPSFILSKETAGLSGRYWKLLEINGKKIPANTSNKEAFLYINPDNNSFAGNGSCNAIMGTYEISGNNKIAFGGIASMNMACPDMDTELEYRLALESTDHYVVRGDYLILENAFNQAQARFQIVFMR